MRCSKSPPTTPHLLAGWLALCGLALLAAPVLAAGSGDEESEPEAPAPAGLRAYVDPETGELTSSPSPDQVAALVDSLSKSQAPALSRSTEGLELFQLHRGGRGVYLEGRFQSALTARWTTDGGFDLLCVDDPEHAHEVFAGEPVPTTPPQWVEK